MSSRGITVVADVAVVGLAERYDELRHLPEAQVANELRAHAIAADLPMPGSRGVPDVMAWIVDHLRGRTLLHDLGEHQADVDWLFFHVPPGGSGSLIVRNQSEAQCGVELKVLGSGFGNGRAVKLSVSDNYLSRKRCMRLVQQVDVRVRTYSLGERGPEAAADVVRVRATQVVPADPCPLCGLQIRPVDRLDYEQAGPGIDLRQDDTGQQHSESMSLDSRSEVELGLELDAPGLGPLKVGLTARRTLNLLCQVEYVFPAGAHLVPYRPATPTVMLPFWALG